MKIEDEKDEAHKHKENIRHTYFEIVHLVTNGVHLARDGVHLVFPVAMS